MDNADHKRRISQDITTQSNKSGGKAAAPQPMHRTKSKVDAVTKQKVKDVKRDERHSKTSDIQVPSRNSNIDDEDPYGYGSQSVTKSPRTEKDKKSLNDKN